MDKDDVVRLEGAVAALNDWDLDPFVALMADEMTWEGARTGLRWWRPS
ncbi:MAG: hypothetical protein ACR2H3_00280 [Acidimicrobiales bacterium]